LNKEEKRIEGLRERLKLFSEILRNLVILLIAVVGGTVSLLFKLSNPVAIPLMFMGLILTVGILFGIFRLVITIRELLQELEKWEKS
jgi:TRAP-type C4-dicarboxylate transport system permease small subunit